LLSSFILVLYGNDVFLSRLLYYLAMIGIDTEMSDILLICLKESSAMILEVKEVRKIFKRLSDLEDKLFQVMEEFAQVKKFDV
jgi:hypothetical protein